MHVMSNIQNIKDKNAVLVPIKDWEKMNKELVRLRKRVKKAKILAEIKAAIITLQNDLKTGKEPKGIDAREFVNELRNEK